MSYKALTPTGRHAGIAFALVCLLVVFFDGVSGLKCHAAVSPKELAASLSRLDAELDNRQSYIRQRKTKADSLRSALKNTSDPASRLDIYLRLGDTYSTLNIDSALWFYSHGHDEAVKTNLDSVTTLFNLRQATYLPLLGFFSAADSIFDLVRLNGIPASLQAEYFDADRQASFYTSTFFADYTDVSQAFLDNSIAAQKKLVDLLPEGSPRQKLNLAEALFFNHQYRKAKTLLEGLVGEISDTNPLYARATHILADIAKAEGDTRTYIYYLALSATADVKCATLEVSSLQELGNVLYLGDDLDRAHDYMNVALENAVECHAPLRMIEASRMLPFVQKAHNHNARRSYIILWLALLIALLTIGIALTAFVRVRNRQRQLQVLTRQLDDSSRMKDAYISQFLKLCSIYMEKLTSFNRVVYGKLIAGKSDDLIKLTKTGKMVEELSSEFYEMFDEVLLGLYPDFVEEVNALLQEGAKIELKEGERLNVELRILALMRLGISDAANIARMLNYSVNTIYTYRNKLKNRAIDRDTFESAVMAIK